MIEFTSYFSACMAPVLGAGAQAALSAHAGPSTADAPAHEASELTVLAILEQPDDAGAFHPVTFE